MARRSTTKPKAPLSPSNPYTTWERREEETGGELVHYILPDPLAGCEPIECPLLDPAMLDVLVAWADTATFGAYEALRAHDARACDAWDELRSRSRETYYARTTLGFAGMPGVERLGIRLPSGTLPRPAPHRVEVPWGADMPAGLRGWLVSVVDQATMRLRVARIVDEVRDRALIRPWAIASACCPAFRGLWGHAFLPNARLLGAIAHEDAAFLETALTHLMLHRAVREGRDQGRPLVELAWVTMAGGR